MNYVFMFPGQNSRHPQMIANLRNASPIADSVLKRASDTLGRDLLALYCGDQGAMFARNRDIQIGVFLANYIFARNLEAAGYAACASVGLSLGEYNHLVEIGALSLEDALLLLEARGAAYEAAPRGCMTSVFPCSPDEVDAALAVGRRHGCVDVSIHLTDTHYVLGGDQSAVSAAVAWLEDETCSQSRVVDPDLPMHASCFKPAGDTFQTALGNARWQVTTGAYLPNTDAQPIENATGAEISGSLYRHVFSTVRWAESVDYLTSRWEPAVFVEVGPRKVLHDVVSRQHRTARVCYVDGGDNGIRMPPRE